MSNTPHDSGATTSSQVKHDEGIDDLVESLGASFAVRANAAYTGVLCIVNYCFISLTGERHPRYGQYKNSGERTLEAGQQRRRDEMLERQKKLVFMLDIYINYMFMCNLFIFISILQITL
jgi:hypothetical protein